MADFIKYDPLILEEAKRRYPIGTKFVGIRENGEIITSKIIPAFYHGGVGITATGQGEGGVVYLNGEWAEIISPTPEKIKNPKFKIFN